MLNLLEMLGMTLAFLGFRNTAVVKRYNKGLDANISRFRAWEQMDPSLSQRSQELIKHLQDHNARAAALIGDFMAALALPKADRDAKAKALSESGDIDVIRQTLNQDNLDQAVAEIIAAMPLPPTEDAGILRVRAYHEASMRYCARCQISQTQKILEFVESEGDVVLNTLDALVDVYGAEAVAELWQKFADAAKAWTAEAGAITLGASEEAQAQFIEGLPQVMGKFDELVDKMGLTPAKALFIGAALGPLVQALPVPQLQPLIHSVIERNCDIEEALQALANPSNPMEFLASMGIMHAVEQLRGGIDTDTEYWGDGIAEEKKALEHKVVAGGQALQRLKEKVAGVEEDLNQANIAAASAADVVLRDSVPCPEHAEALQQAQDHVESLKRRHGRGLELIQQGESGIAEAKARLAEIAENESESGDDGSAGAEAAEAAVEAAPVAEKGNE